MREARRLHTLGLSLGGVAETLLDQTGYANARSAERALRWQFKWRGWPLRSRAQARQTRRQHDDPRRLSGTGNQTEGRVRWPRRASATASCATRRPPS